MYFLPKIKWKSEYWTRLVFSGNALTTQEACTDFSEHLNTGLVGYLNNPFWSKHLNNKLVWYLNSYTRTPIMSSFQMVLNIIAIQILTLDKFVQYSNGCWIPNFLTLKHFLPFEYWTRLVFICLLYLTEHLTLGHFFTIWIPD